jgi:hypothetical protein
MSCFREREKLCEHESENIESGKEEHENMIVQAV